MEFVSEKEVYPILRDFGIEPLQESEDRVELDMQSDGPIVRIQLTSEESGAQPLDGVELIKIDKEQFPAIVERVLHQLHLTQVLLVPVGKWRNIFDLVAFSLAESESWQAVDAAATVELNQRDPLLCLPADFPTLKELLAALFKDGDAPEQGLMLVSTAAPILIEIIPDGAMNVSIGNQVLADELADAFAMS